MSIKKRYKRQLNSFGIRIKDIRIRKGISQEQLAVNANISYTTVFNLENDGLNPTLGTILALADALEVDAGDLVKGL